MNYKLAASNETSTTLGAIKKLWSILRTEKNALLIALVFILLNAITNLLGPFFVARAIDRGITLGKYHVVVMYALVISGLYLIALGSSYLQTRLMGGVGQRTLYNLRNALFTKLQELPVAFFNQNKAGDLISRLNNDTDKLNQFFSQSLVQFVGNIFVMLGAAVFLISINWKLGLTALIPALFIVVFTQLISPWVKRKNMQSLTSTGGLSAEIQESINNFKVVIAFNRRDYFREKFAKANDDNYVQAIGAGIANNTFTPVYGFAANIGQLIVLGYGVALIVSGQFTIGLLISFLAYVTNVYNPLRQLAAIWPNFQTALAGWDRISHILNMKNDLTVLPATQSYEENALVTFKNVSFKYFDSDLILKNINLSFVRGKTYALVGPTGGGKSTTASLIARLFDATEGIILLDGKDIRSFSSQERTSKIGFILQEPFLFSGTVRQNIVYGNTIYQGATEDMLRAALQANDLESLINRFEKGLDTMIGTSDSMSIGQKQIIAFVRAVLRKPELLILDEATANIDTVTEKILDDILKRLPKETALVIIAHRLNTIANADEIYFVNAGQVIAAGSMENAVDMLLHGKRSS